MDHQILFSTSTFSRAAIGFPLRLPDILLRKYQKKNSKNIAHGLLENDVRPRPASHRARPATHSTFSPKIPAALSPLALHPATNMVDTTTATPVDRPVTVTPTLNSAPAATTPTQVVSHPAAPTSTPTGTVQPNIITTPLGTVQPAVLTPLERKPLTAAGLTPLSIGGKPITIGTPGISAGPYIYKRVTVSTTHSRYPGILRQPCLVQSCLRFLLASPDLDLFWEGGEDTDTQQGTRHVAGVGVGQAMGSRVGCVVLFIASRKRRHPRF